MQFTVPVTLHTRGVAGADSYGKDTFDETVTTVQGVFAPGPSTENVEGQDQIVTGPTVYIPDVGLTAIDRVTVLGIDYDVDGTPQVWPANPYSGWRPECPVVVKLKRVGG